MNQIEQLKQYKNDYLVVPVYEEILGDCITPIEVLKILKSVSHHCYLLESVENQEIWGRYTYLGFDPTMEVTALNHLVTVKKNGVVQKNDKDIDTTIQEILDQYSSPKIKGIPPFTGGLVGYFSYDYAKYAESKLNLTGEDKEGFKDVDLMLFDKVIAFDSLKQKIYIIANAFTERLEQDYERCKREITAIIRLLQNKRPDIEEAGRATSPFQPLFNEEEYCKMVEIAKKHIYEGDIFQVVLSNRLEAEFSGSLLSTYRVLRTLNPSPYMFYFSSDDMEVAGASPETLVKLEDNILHTFPLAGTRRRGKDEREDKALEEELLADEKELAEHNMLVDLGRNDLGKISEFGTVEVENYMDILRFSHVMHIGSTVRGKIADSYKALDAINAVLPAGTLSGAPKLKAMQIIDGLEKNKRGIYGGAIGYLAFTKDMDTCIAIRIAYKKNGKVFIRSGAGIVADSDPRKEFKECMNKAMAVIKAVEGGKNL